MLRTVQRNLTSLFRRRYGWEEKKEKIGRDWWNYSRFTSQGDKLPTEQGKQWSGQQQQWLDEVNDKGHVTYAAHDNYAGVDDNRVIDAHLSEHPLGNFYGEQLQTKPKNEIKTRIIHVLRHFEKMDLKSIDWDGDIEKDLGLDEYERIALITSVEHEFKTIFEDNFFDNIISLNDVVNYVNQETYAY